MADQQKFKPDISPGDKVQFMGASDGQAHRAGCDDPREHLVVGKTYTVLRVDVHSWHTKIILVEYPASSFNSTVFTRTQKAF